MLKFVIITVLSSAQLASNHSVSLKSKLFHGPLWKGHFALNYPNVTGEVSSWICIKPSHEHVTNLLLFPQYFIDVVYFPCFVNFFINAPFLIFMVFILPFPNPINNFLYLWSWHIEVISQF